MERWQIEALYIWPILAILTGIIAGLMRRGLWARPKLTGWILGLAYVTVSALIVSCLATDNWTDANAPYLLWVLFMLLAATVDRVVSGSGITRR